MLRLKTFAPLIGIVLLASACGDDLTVEDPNNVPLETLIENPTLAGLNAASVGLLVSGRDEYDDRNGMVSLFGILGRESYNFDGSDPRFVTEMLENPLNPSSPAFGGNIWSERYANLRTGTIILAGIPQIDDAVMPAGEKSAMAGFAKTQMAFELLITINAHDTNGAVTSFSLDVNTPQPIETKDQVLDDIAAMLDDGAADLTNAANAGASFTFALPSGFADFGDPASFRTYNRALAARVDLYRGDDAGARDALLESFVDTTASLTLGAYHSFSDLPGDRPNDLFDPGDTPDLLAHPSVKDSVQQQPGGADDQRFQDKIRSINARTRLGLSSDVAFTIYNTTGAPIPIIRNEELILIRSEVNFNLANQPDAFTDLNFIRVNSGGLAPAALTPANYQNELLYNRWFSLMFEGGHRWIDYRRLGILSSLPLDTPSSRHNSAFPIPEAECLARGLEASGTGCTGA